jgi:PIN domain nuclease of toxin-antitoxin system
MNLLLDTHVFIWWDSEPDKLSQRALSLCENPESKIFFSVTSLWEIQIKSQLGKIKLAKPIRELIEDQCEVNTITLLTIQSSHVFELDGLPPVHKDPFDRMLIAQARSENLRFVTHDAVLADYPVEIEW